MNLPKKQGFILIEVLLSIIILSVSVSLIIQAMTTSLRASVYNAGYSTSLMLLENKASELIFQKFVQSGLKQQEAFSYPFEHFQYGLEAVPYHDEGNKINIVHLFVEWPTNKKNRQVSLETLLFNPPDEQKK